MRALFVLFVLWTLNAAATTEGSASIESLDPRTAASCDVISHRLFYEMIRKKQQAALAAKLASRKRLDKDELADLRQVSSTIGLPDARLNSTKIVATWPYSGGAWVTAKVEVADVLWEGAAMPEWVTLMASGGALELNVLTNPSDACFGPDFVNVALKFADGHEEDFAAVLVK